MDGGIMTSRLLVDKIEGKASSGTIQMPAGHVIQVKTLTTSTTNNITSASFVDVAGMSMSFAAKFSNSLLLCTIQNHVYLDAAGGTWNGVDFKVLKDSTAIYSGGTGGGGGYGTSHSGGSTSADRHMMYVTQNFEHSPNSTSSHTYKVQVHITNNEANGTKEVNNPAYGANGRFIIMEIAQ